MWHHPVARWIESQLPLPLIPEKKPQAWAWKTPRPASESRDSAFQQVGRNHTDAQDSFLLNPSHILIDRDTKFVPFRDYLKAHTEIDPVLLPPRSPNCNACMERFMLSLKSESLDWMIFFGEASLRKALREFETNYHKERNYQGLEILLRAPFTAIDSSQTV